MSCSAYLKFHVSTCLSFHVSGHLVPLYLFTSYTYCELFIVHIIASSLCSCYSVFRSHWCSSGLGILNFSNYAWNDIKLDTLMFLAASCYFRIQTFFTPKFRATWCELMDCVNWLSRPEIMKPLGLMERVGLLFEPYKFKPRTSAQ